MLFPTAVATEARFREVAIGGRFACGLTAEGDAACWGYNRDGQLGRGDDRPSMDIALVQSTVPLQRIVAGREHACALDGSGAAYCWGSNRNGQVGDSARVRRGSFHARPVPVSGGYRYQDLIMVGGDMSCGLTRSGQVYCWGRVDLIDWNARPTSTPVLVSGDMVFESLAGDGDHVCALSNGKAYCWGENRSGQLGDGSRSRRSEPTAVQTDSLFIDLASGTDFNCGLTAAGQGWCWGANHAGPLGTGEGSFANQGWPTPQQVFGELRFRELVAGSQHVCGLATDATLYCWGDNNAGQLGTGTGGWRNIPTAALVPR